MHPRAPAVKAFSLFVFISFASADYLFEHATLRSTNHCQTSFCGQLHDIQRVVVGNTKVIVAAWTNGIGTVDLSDPAVPRLSGFVPGCHSARRIAVDGDLAFVVTRKSSLCECFEPPCETNQAEPMGLEVINIRTSRRVFSSRKWFTFADSVVVDSVRRLLLVGGAICHINDTLCDTALSTAALVTLKIGQSNTFEIASATTYFSPSVITFGFDNRTLFATSSADSRILWFDITDPETIGDSFSVFPSTFPVQSIEFVPESSVLVAGTNTSLAVFQSGLGEIVTSTTLNLHNQSISVCVNNSFVWTTDGFDVAAWEFSNMSDTFILYSFPVPQAACVNSRGTDGLILVGSNDGSLWVLGIQIVPSASPSPSPKSHSPKSAWAMHIIVLGQFVVICVVSWLSSKENKYAQSVSDIVNSATRLKPRRFAVRLLNPPSSTSPRATPTHSLYRSMMRKRNRTRSGVADDRENDVYLAMSDRPRSKEDITLLSTQLNSPTPSAPSSPFLMSPSHDEDAHQPTE